MSRRGKRRSGPAPDANVKQIVCELEKALTLEDKYRSNLLVAKKDQKPGEVSLTARDDAVHSLRFLKAWLNLPSEIFFTSIGLLDRFLTRMKVQEKYFACLTMSCLYIAADIHKYPIEASHLLRTAQAKCSINDLERMCDIIRKKLDIESKEQPVTVYSYLNLMLRMWDCAAIKLNVKPLSSRMLQKKVLYRRLEVLMSNYNIASARHPVVALALIQHDIEKFLAAEEVPSKSPYYSIEMLKMLTLVAELQTVCLVNAEDLSWCYKHVKEVLQHYDDYDQLGSKQKKEWRFSTSTLFTPRLLDNFCTNLSRIREDA